jgi:hypothetical protein
MTLFCQALIYVVATWLPTAGIVLLIFLTISMADFGEVVLGALSFSVHVTWLIPALLLVSLPSSFAAAAGIGLASSAAWLLLSGHIPRIGIEPRRVPRARAIRWLILGAMVFQFGFCAWWMGHPLAAAAFITAGVSVWTQASIVTGLLPRRKKAGPGIAFWIIGGTLLATTLLLAVQLRPAAATGTDPDLVETAQYMIHAVADPPAPKRETKKAVATRIFSRKEDPVAFVPDGVPGVILRPNVKSPEPIGLSGSSETAHLPLLATRSFPFTGEYHLFPTSTGGIPVDSLRLVGTPLEAAYKSLTEGPIETEAYQVIDPPYDFGACSQLQVVMSSEESAPGIISAGLLAGGEWLQLGSNMFGFDVRKTVSEETLGFDVPVRAPRSLEVSAIRLLFRRDPSQVNRSARVAIDRFILIPRRTRPLN